MNDNCPPYWFTVARAIPPIKHWGTGKQPDGVAVYPLLLVLLLLIANSAAGGNALHAQSAVAVKPNAPVAGFDSQEAFHHLENVCGLGRRFSTSRGMTQQREYLREQFESIGAEVFMQPFSARDPRDGRQVELANMIVRFHPHRSKRLLLCCHYDTRPFPDLDQRNPHGVFIGANDGGSGVAVLCELGRHLQSTATTPETSLTNSTDFESNPEPASTVRPDDGKYGIDFAFFDGEEFVYVHRRDPMFLGSTYFATSYVNAGGPPQNQQSGNLENNLVQTLPRSSRYVFAILIDMVGDKNLQIYYEGNSLKYAPRLTKSIWDVAARMKAKAFIPKKRHELRDDHLPLNQIARIPTCDIIDFDFPSPRRKHVWWHTEQDVVKNCSAKSLGTVGSVLLEWLTEMQQLADSDQPNSAAQPASHSVHSSK